jgi:hypothetical protein
MGEKSNSIRYGKIEERGILGCGKRLVGGTYASSQISKLFCNSLIKPSLTVTSATEPSYYPISACAVHVMRTIELTSTTWVTSASTDTVRFLPGTGGSGDTEMDLI